MLRSIEAAVEVDGRITLKETIQLNRRHRAIVTILDDVDIEDTERVAEAALLSEPSLKIDWDRKEEDEAWSHLQPDR